MADHASDTELWRRAALGDQDAFATLFERHVQAVWNHAYRLTGSWPVAEDLASATFLTAWRKRAEVTLVNESALPWLYTVAGNLARTEHRSSARRLRLVRKAEPPADVSDHADSVVDRVSAGDRLRELAAAVTRLPTAQRRVVELCLLGELPVPDAAVLLGLAESSVRSHLSRARARLRTELEETR
ncbi:RNA polymerase sigma-70 factor (ECF subfamily) [Amycolatopsis magusensis]|uniref:RNA polymerase sigma-70 factor (ECF subfamily) n=1 Tax=Amycolatopsis magusensis TaxID=882444 RepID=A0ABS4PXB4_9PSEU|nr:RNA polymerase sigma-70 factor (ECF subfamily) [Amycolatopsis magusensis]